MRQLENVSETLVSSYFSSREVVADKFSSDLSSENPYWDTGHTVPPLSDICIKVRPCQVLDCNDRMMCLQILVRCFSWKPLVSARLRGHDKQRFMDQLSVSESLMTTFAWLEEGLYWRRR